MHGEYGKAKTRLVLHPMVCISYPLRGIKLFLVWFTLPWLYRQSMSLVACQRRSSLMRNSTPPLCIPPLHLAINMPADTSLCPPVSLFIFFRHCIAPVACAMSRTGSHALWSFHCATEELCAIFVKLGAWLNLGSAVARGRMLNQSAFGDMANIHAVRQEAKEFRKTAIIAWPNFGQFRKGIWYQTCKRHMGMSVQTSPAEQEALLIPLNIYIYIHG